MVGLYYLSWAVFGAVGLLLNFGLRRPHAASRIGRRLRASSVRSAIRRLFRAWLAWLHATGVVAVEWAGFDGEELQPGTVYIANHPTLIDATFILARLPDAICIFKPSLMSNPAVGPAAVMAGYVRGDTGHRPHQGRGREGRRRPVASRLPRGHPHGARDPPRAG